jgi:serine/threonine protein kinase
MPLPKLADLPPLLAGIVEKTRTELAEDWAAGRCPVIEGRLAEAPAPARAVLLAELLQVELAYRSKAGQDCELAEYQARFPQDVALVAAVFAALAGGSRADSAGVRTPSPVTTPPQPTAPLRRGEPNSGSSLRGDLPCIPGYEILGELGRGGMGVVYKARQLSHDRLVALKMILSGHGAALVDLVRFHIEAEAVACLDHPNVIRIHEVGVYGGCPYLALELAEAGTLAKLRKEQSRPPRWAAEVVKTLADAIQLAHGRGILHRDLKPANVLLMADGTIKISDFGLAKFEQPMHEVADLYCTLTPRPTDKLRADWQRQRTSQELARGIEFEMKAVLQQAEQAEPPAWLTSLAGGLTTTGAIMGSPQYMAPEQARGDTDEIGPATDIYALGAILYYLLAGRPPFTGAGLEEVLHKVRTEPPPAIEPRVSRELDAICRACLDKRIDRRYAAAAELAQDLQRFLEGYAALGPGGGAGGPPAAQSRARTLQQLPTTRYDPSFTSGSDAERTRYRTRWWQFWK